MANPCKLPIRPRPLAAVLEAALGLRPLAAVYERRPPAATAPEPPAPVPPATAQAFLQYTLDASGVNMHISRGDNLQEIPASGPLLIVANHPLGGLEGIALARLMGQIRPDLRVLTNRLLRLIPELADIFIGVDVLSGDAAAANVAGIKQVHRHLKGGGAVLIFPAGTVSAWDFRNRCIRDLQWNRLVGQLIRRYQCTTVPVHVGGRNPLDSSAAAHPAAGPAVGQQAGLSAGFEHRAASACHRVAPAQQRTGGYRLPPGQQRCLSPRQHPARRLAHE